MENEPEKRKIIDLTGNREEKIAPKNRDASPESGTARPGNGGKWKERNKKRHGKDRRGYRDGNRTERDDLPKQDAPAGEETDLNETDAPVEEHAVEPDVSAIGATIEVEGTDAGEAAPQEEPAVPEEPVETIEVVGVRFRGTGKVYFFSPNGIAFEAGDHTIVETVRGVEYGDVTMANRMIPAKDIVQPLKPVIRKADANDIARFEINCRQEENAKPVFIEKCAKHHLDMQLVDAEYTFDGMKLTFYFTADGRVDFRELVKDLASVFHTRIELRQLAAHEEAKLIGGLGLCGRPVCCNLFLADCKQPSIQMAKDQNVSLASPKISGLCGRRMCCLRFEQEVYETESKRMPQPETEIDTPKGKGIVLESSFLSGKVKVKLNDDNSIRTYTTAELNGEAKPEKTPRKQKTGPSDYLLSYGDAAEQPDVPEEKCEEGRPEPRQPKQHKHQKQQKQQKPQQTKEQRREAAEPNGENVRRDDERRQHGGNANGGGKNKHRFNRPNNLRKKGPAGNHSDGRK